MNEIKVYEQLTQIETFDWMLYTPAKPSDLDRMVEERKFIQIWEERIAVHQIKRYYPQKINWIEAHILWKSKEVQKILRERERAKRERVWRGFDSIDEIENYLKTKEIE